MSLVVGEAAGDGSCRRSRSLSYVDGGATQKTPISAKQKISCANVINAVLCGATLSGWYVTRHALWCGIALTQSQCLKFVFSEPIAQSFAVRSWAKQRLSETDNSSFVGRCQIKILAVEQIFVFGMLIRHPCTQTKLKKKPFRSHAQMVLTQKINVLKFS